MAKNKPLKKRFKREYTVTLANGQKLMMNARNKDSVVSRLRGKKIKSVVLSSVLLTSKRGISKQADAETLQALSFMDTLPPYPKYGMCPKCKKPTPLTSVLLSSDTHGGMTERVYCPSCSYAYRKWTPPAPVPWVIGKPDWKPVKKFKARRKTCREYR